MLKVGKLDSDLLKEIVIDKIKYKRPEVLTRAGVGEDCAVMDFGEYECVMSTDPITAAVSDIGKLAIHISCNDIASNGIQPMGIMLTVLLPEGTTEEDVKTIMEQAASAAEMCRVEIIGGHTEITTAVNKPVIVSTAVGRGHKGKSASAEKIQVGDLLIMTKTAGLEGTGIIASDLEAELTGELTEEELKHAKALLKDVSVVKEGVVAGDIGTHGMHDVTEGGILGAVWELCEIAGVGVELEKNKIPVDKVTLKICKHYGIDYLRLISSGSMIIAATPEKATLIIEALKQQNIVASIIGKTVGKENGMRLSDGEKSIFIEPPKADELYKAVK